MKSQPSGLQWGRMMRTVTGLVVASLALAGCTSLPKTLRSEPVSVAQLITAVQCEIASVHELGDKADAIADWAAGTQFDLKVTDNVDFVPGLTLKPAIANVSLTLSGGTGVDDQAFRHFSFRIVTPVWQVDPDTEAGAKLAAQCPRSDSPAAATGLGIGQNLREVANAISSGDITFSSLTNLSQILDFTVTRSATGGLVFDAGVVSVKHDRSGVSRKRENRIAMTFERSTRPTESLEESGGEDDDLFRRINESLDELTREPGLVLRPGDTLVVTPP